MFSANSSQVTDDKLFVEDVFSTYLYRGNGTTQTITNGIDLAGKGGLVWIKDRTIAQNNNLYDTVRGATKMLTSNSAASQYTLATSITAFTGSGFTTGSYPETNENGSNFASWTFREAPKFFDIVTYTGNGANRTIAHNLGSAPGMMIIKRTDAAENWAVYHRGFPSPSTQYGILNDYLGTPTTATNVWNSTNPTTSVFSVGTNALVNANGGTYVAYLYAHDTTADGIVQCGSFTTNGSANASVTLGWEPQWVMIKDLNDQQYYAIYDNMRGLTSAVSGSRQLFASTSNAEGDNPVLAINATGFSINQYANTNYIYVAIRRGPMRTPTLGTSVFAPVSQAGGGTITTNFPVDLALTAQNTLVGDKYSFDRLRGSASTSSKYLITNKTDAEATVGAGFGLDNNLGYKDNGIFSASYNAIYWNFRRAPGFFDEVCYTGTGASDVKPHNLGVAPELMIFKRRNSTGGWLATSNFTATTHRWGYLNTTAAMGESSYSFANILFAAPTATGFTLRTADENNASGGTYVAYLFASAPGVSKVGSYTGNGSSQTINCGFAAGARFVMIKRTDSTGDWYVWDSARGIVAGNDPRLSLNTTAGEVTTDDSVDTDSSGFVVNQVAATNVNVNAATYIYLAIA